MPDSPESFVDSELIGSIAAVVPDDMPVLTRTGTEFLRAVRRSRLPPEVRRQALVVLAEIGWIELDPADRELVRRLIRVKLLREEPLRPVAVNASWFAFTANTAEVVAAFGLGTRLGLLRV